MGRSVLVGQTGQRYRQQKDLFAVSEQQKGVQKPGVQFAVDLVLVDQRNQRFVVVVLVAELHKIEAVAVVAAVVVRTDLQ